MAIKGVIQQDHIPLNGYTLYVLGIPIPLVFTKITGLDEELDTVDLPDRTSRTGARSKPIEFEVTQPMHHTLEHYAMEAWMVECTGKVSPTYKKTCTLVLNTQSGAIGAGFALEGVFITKRALPDFDMNNDGEMAEIVWTLRADEMHPVR